MPRCFEETRAGLVHVKRITVENMRSIRRFELDLGQGDLAGWHVILGDNGAGKSTFVRTLALALMGLPNAHATRQDWSNWLSIGSSDGYVEVELREHEVDQWAENEPQIRGAITVKASLVGEPSVNGRKRHQVPVVMFSESHGMKAIGGGGEGWFSASFGPFRRFAGSDPDMDKLYLSHPRLAPHLSAFGENVALGECLRWLKNLQIKKLEGDEEAKVIQEKVISFINGANLLPHGAHIAEVTSEQAVIVDGGGSRISVDEMSDGYRSILSLTFELMRLMFSIFDTETALAGIDVEAGTVTLPGVVAIDEIDAHLHPQWQQDIGDWFVEHFPQIQFFVTTHSPIVCRSARRGSVWLLPAPGSGEEPRRIVGHDLGRLIDGNLLDAYGTELFGEDVTRSEQSKAKLLRLAQLNRKRLSTPLSETEQRDLNELRATMPSTPNRTEPD